jgi:phosphatidylserine/phosphatidylglycerophosphate/cardiolipin synthase-like enzyme
MENIRIRATNRSPAVSFDFARHHLRIKGESYPEDVLAFYGPILASLDTYLASLRSGRCRCDLSLVYFNSGSAKALMLLLEKLDEAAARGAAIEIYWYYDENDDTMRELGEEFGEDLRHAAFHLEVMGR